MRVLFLYKYGILGGVCTQLHHRMATMTDRIEVHCGFMTSQGAEKLLSGICTLHFGVTAEKMESLITEINFDLVIIIDTEEYVQRIALMENLPPIVIEVHTSIEKNLEYLENIPLKINPKFITVSEFMRGEIEKRVNFEREDLIVIGNIIDTEKFYFTPLKQNTTVEERPPIVWIGKIDDHKNWRAALEICSSLKSSGKVHDLWIVGGHTATQRTVEEFLGTVEDFGLIEDLRWFDKIEHDAMPELLRKARSRGGVGLVTSKGESFGMSIMESLLVGLPVVCSNTGAISELSEDRDFMPLFELGDNETAIRELQGLIGTWHTKKEYRTLVEKESKSLGLRFNSKTTRENYWSTLVKMCEE